LGGEFEVRAGEHLQKTPPALPSINYSFYYALGAAKGIIKTLSYI
jgi:hypothetical protein